MIGVRNEVFGWYDFVYVFEVYIYYVYWLMCCQRIGDPIYVVLEELDVCNGFFCGGVIFVIVGIFIGVVVGCGLGFLWKDCYIYIVFMDGGDSLFDGFGVCVLFFLIDKDHVCLFNSLVNVYY